MSRILRRTSFTTKLLALATLVLGLLVLVDYVALLELPRRIARDSVEIALRENVQSLNSTIRDDRLSLDERADSFLARGDVQRAIRERDASALEMLLDELAPDARIAYKNLSQVDGSGLGMIIAPRTLQGADGPINVTFYRPITSAVLDRAAETASGEVSFALEHEGRFVARSSGFPRSISPEETDAPLDPNSVRVGDVDVDGEARTMYSRALTTDSSYHLHALATPALERDAIADIRDDVRLAIGGMTVATMLAFIMLVGFTNRTVGRFGQRVRSLADGDYGTQLEVRGGDAFADLAASVNRLGSQLDEQVGQLEDTAGAFQRTLETLEEGICVWNEHGEVRFWNRGAEQLTGLGRERVELSDPVVAFLHAERTPGTRRVTLPVRRTGGGLVADLVVTAMPDGGVVQTFRDTTMLDMLQQTQRNFMATAAHELRTPITTILGFADTLTNPDLELTDRQREEFLAIIAEHAHELQALTEAFFTNHQLANERVEVSIEQTGVDAAVADALERVRHALPDRAADVEDVDVMVLPSVRVLADRRALVGVLSVLIENAIKYGALPITVAAEVKGGTVALLVRDSGPGIEAYHQSRIFDPFYRIDVDMRSGVGGAGLGLFTARKLVESMHGIIRVRSTPGAGATFIVELPAVHSGSGRDEGNEGRSLQLVSA